MAYIIDAHQDLAYNALTFGRNYLQSAGETRRQEQGGPTPQRNGHTLLGWPDYQRGQIAALFGTLFLTPRRYQRASWETQVFSDTQQAYQRNQEQLNFYRRLTDENPDQFRLVLTRQDLSEVLAPWEKSPAYLPAESDNQPGSQDVEPDPRPSVTHPVGIVLLMEGAEGIHSPKELEEWYERGVRLLGPVWAGTRFCGGTYEPGDFTAEGFELMEVMASLGLTLDISHMTEASALQALDRYEGPIIATHANARALIKGADNERHLTDRTIRQLIERDGVMGVLPYNRFLDRDWYSGGDRRSVTLHTLAAHIDHICQIAGNSLHVGIGTDFDGGFGWPDVPYGIETIADLQKLAPTLKEIGYSDESIDDIFGRNWRRHLERSLPER
jgi:membrane dipeptidase